MASAGTWPRASASSAAPNVSSRCPCERVQTGGMGREQPHTDPSRHPNSPIWRAPSATPAVWGVLGGSPACPPADGAGSECACSPACRGKDPSPFAQAQVRQELRAPWSCSGSRVRARGRGGRRRSRGPCRRTGAVCRWRGTGRRRSIRARSVRGRRARRHRRRSARTVGRVPVGRRCSPQLRRARRAAERPGHAAQGRSRCRSRGP